MVALSVIFVFLLTLVFQGFTLMVLWGWFAVPTFHLPALNIPQALGISMVVSFLTHQYHKDERSTAEQIGYAILECVIALIIGWIIHLFM